MKFGGKTFDTQFTNNGIKSKEFMHEMHKIFADVTFTQMTSNKGINIHIE